MTDQQKDNKDNYERLLHAQLVIQNWEWPGIIAHQPRLIQNILCA